MPTNFYNTNDRVDASQKNITTIPLGAAVSATGEQTLLVSPSAALFPEGAKYVVIDEVLITLDTTVTADNTNYWDFQIVNKTASVNLLATAQDTTITAGSTITANEAWSIVPDQNASIGAGNIIELNFTKHSSGANLTNCSATIVWHWGY